MKKLLLVLIMAVFTFCGCEKNPAGALMYNGVYDSDPSTWADPFVIYRNGDIMTRVVPFDKAIGAYTNIWEKYASPQNVLKAQCKGESSGSGYMSIKMGWSGQASETFGTNTTVNNVAFWLTTTNTGGPKDFSASGYTKFSFWYKSEVRSGTEIVINVFGHAYPSTDFVISASSGWTKHEIDISSYSNNSVSTYITVTMQPAGGAATCDGATIYLDDIRLSK